MRFFVIDSMAYTNMERQIKAVKPDVIEILPALLPKKVQKIVDETDGIKKQTKLISAQVLVAKGLEMDAISSPYFSY